MSPLPGCFHIPEHSHDGYNDCCLLQVAEDLLEKVRPCLYLIEHNLNHAGKTSTQVSVCEREEEAGERENDI